MIIALTGGIATGKSTVSSLLDEMGALVIDADKINHDVLKKIKVKSEVRKAFGNSVFNGDEINRKILGEVIFNNGKKRNHLEKITHPRIKKEIIRKIKDNKKKNR